MMYTASPKILLVISILLTSLISCNPWSSETEQALKRAGANRGELEKVLKHYAEVDPDPLKFKAAEFLISNMIYQYSQFGPGVDSLGETYKHIYGVYRENRNTVFMSDSMRQRKKYRIDAEFDLLRLTSDHLIRQIESAFETYNRFEWCRSYPFETFCEYILPYKIRSSDSTVWRSYAREKFVPMLEYLAFKRPESIHEAELRASKNSKVKVEAASGNYVYNLHKKNEPFDLSFQTKWSGPQLFRVHYLNGHKTAAIVRILLDGISIGDIVFPGTGDWRIIDKEVPPLEFTVKLEAGDHRLQMVALDKNILLDFVEVPDYVYMNSPNSRVEQGQYYLSNRLGRVTVLNDTLVNGSRLKIHSHPSKGRPVNILAKGNLYEIVFEQSGLKKAIDAYPSGETDWVHLYDDLGFPNQLWALIPTEKSGFQIRNRETGRILGFRESDSTLAQLPASLMRDDYIWYLEELKNDSIKDSSNQLDIAIETAQKISEITNQFHWSGSYVEIGPIMPKLILDYTFGSCVEETDFQTMVLRAMGVACTVDFVINYPERNAGHTWSVIFDSKGNTIQNNCHNPVGAGTWVDVFAKGKVYRKTSSINRKSLFLINNNKELIPPVFQSPYFIDVTREYCKVRDVDVKISASQSKNKFAYLMVFNNDGWVPIGWGEREDKNTIRFKDVEPGPMYLPAFYDNGSFEPFNEPFHFDSLGNMHYVTVSNDSIPQINLTRKSPNRAVNESHHKLIIGGKFQGANRSDFSDAVTIGEITDQMLEPVFHVINTSSKKPFKYLRYMGPNEGRCNINEMIFFDIHGNTITGKIIGTDGSFEHNGKTKEMVFDGDVLTYFDAPEPSGSWVGLQLNSPTAISKIRFATRNDGNMVEVGDEYELVYWKNKDWVSLGRKIATSDSLTYDKIPKGGLYWLQNHTKGWEERIFTLDENGQPVWW